MLDTFFAILLNVILGVLCAVVCLLFGALLGYYLFKLTGAARPQRMAILVLGVPLAIGGFLVGYFVIGANMFAG